MAGKSKVISGLATHQAHRRRKDTSLASRVGPDAHQRMREPKGTIGQVLEPSFRAGLTNNPDGVTPGGISVPANVTRNSVATYNAKDGLRIAQVNESRQEWIGGEQVGTLDEPAATNQFLNSSAPVTQNINLSTGAHTISVVGSGSLTSANAGGTATGHGAAIETTPVTINVTGAGEFSFTVSGSLDYAQVEAGEVASSVIITGDAAASRAIDQHTWPLTDSEGRAIFNEAEGMAAIIWRPGFNESILPTFNQIQKILDLGIDQADFFRYQHDSASWTPPSRFYHVPTTPSLAFVSLNAPLESGKQYLLAARWGQTATNCQIGYKHAGTWYWGGLVGFAGSWTGGQTALTLSSGTGQIDYPNHNRNIYIWAQDNGTAWIESYFAGIAE